MKRVFVLITVLLVVSLGLTPIALAGDKVLACHITGTGYNDNGDEIYVGHVISISDKALKAHCKHPIAPDHTPWGVLLASDLACGEDGLDLEGDEYEKCFTMMSIGKPCGRKIASTGPVLDLCD